MIYSHIMVHYGELGTKGENKKFFINELNRQIHWSLRKFSMLKIRMDHNHIYIELNGEDPFPIIERLKMVSGIQRLSLVLRCVDEIEEMKSAALKIMNSEEGKTFKISVKRVNKAFPFDSYQVSCLLAGEILKNNKRWRVDIHNPDLILHIEIREQVVYFSAHDYLGAGGYPLGSNGKAMMMLSGGIDSPVAAYLLLRRGIRIECIHFAAPPYTSDAVLDKLHDILSLLNEYQEEIKLHIIPFTKLQLAIYAHVPEPYCITIMRRMMYRIAERLAKKRGCLAISNGEAIGQVASQTLASMVTINDVTSFPVIRPLATFDKIDVINLAKKIDTYDISIRPYEDCCTIFKPKNPKTRPNLEEAIRLEGLFDYETLIEECLKSLRSETITAK